MWFTENPWPPFLICLLLAAAFLARWYLIRNPHWLWGALGLLTIGGVILIVEATIVTESERVEAGVSELAAAFAAGDANRCTEFFSARDETDRALVQTASGMVKIVGPIRISDLAIDMGPGTARAVATFRASATASYQGHEYRGLTRWELTWQKEAGAWKIIHIQRLKFFGEGPMAPLGPME